MLNVFTRPGDPFSGNPLCVFESGEGLDDAQMQAIARQFNLSETVFLLPSQQATARARIFTPDEELPFAGHPTLGSIYFLSRHWEAAAAGRQALSLETRAGVIPVTVDGHRCTLTALPPSHREPKSSRSDIAAALGVTPSDIGGATADERPLWINTGTEQLLVPLQSAAAVRCARPASEPFARLATEPGQHAHALLFAATAPGSVLARFFFIAGGAVREDPATGSAAANLGGWLLAMNRPAPLELMVSQGEQSLRPSTLLLGVDTHHAIRVRGDVRYLGRGALNF